MTEKSQSAKYIKSWIRLIPKQSKIYELHSHITCTSLYKCQYIAEIIVSGNFSWLKMYHDYIIHPSYIIPELSKELKYSKF